MTMVTMMMAMVTPTVICLAGFTNSEWAPGCEAPGTSDARRTQPGPAA